MKTVKAFFGQPLASFALIVVALVVCSSVFAAVVAPYDPLKQDLQAANSLPSPAHWLGADTLGRDILSRLLHGGQITLFGALIAVSVFLALGVPLGLAAGYFRGWLDAAVSRIVEVLFAVPVMIIVLVVVSVFSGGIAASMVTIGILSFGSLFRVVRGQTMAAARELYVKAARSEGLRGAAILRRHILPNIWGPVIVQASLFLAGAILTESGLAFLGFSVQPPAPSWGAMIGEAARVISAHPWQLVPPGVLIGLLVLCLGLIGDGVRDAVTRSTAPPRTVKPHGQAESTSASGFTARAGSLLAVDHLTVAFGGADPIQVVEDVCFDVLPGETVGIVGESGSGKTVSARAVIGLLGSGGRVVSGQADFAGRDLLGLDKAALRRVRGGEIGLIPQEPMTTLDPVFSIGKQLSEVVRKHGRRPADEPPGLAGSPASLAQRPPAAQPSMRRLTKAQTRQRVL
ncbi:MAG: ABC transporter permease subunit, partial [Propionibacteriaceae bacterium]|nr:ABC transporter permease subunit [Propionibacteriaceae bacterium]